MRPECSALTALVGGRVWEVMDGGLCASAPSPGDRGRFDSAVGAWVCLYHHQKWEMRMGPEEAIQSLPTLMGEIRKRVGAVEQSGGAAYAQCGALGRFGGQRADHAAALLAGMDGELAELERFVGAVRSQIAGWNADPFQRKAQKGGQRVHTP